MRRLSTLTLLAVFVAVGISLPAVTNVSAGSHASNPLAKKVCTTKKVHGKKVCTKAKPKLTPTATPTLSLAQQVDDTLTGEHFSGSVLLEKGGQMLLEKSYGMADRASNTPNTPQTKVPIFGVNYLLAAVGILKLQEEGKLSMQDTVCSYLTTCPAAWQPITLEEVLTETSGIPASDWVFSQGGTDATLAACQARPLTATPGQEIIATDCSAFLLNTVIERVSGLSWADFMQQTIFSPAGMTNSGRMTTTLLPPQRARGYAGSDPAPELSYDAYYMASSTLEDVYRFDTALLAGTILARSSLDALFTPRMERAVDQDSSPLFMGDGGTVIATASSASVSQVFAGSGAWGFTIDDFFSPDSGAVGILLGNDTGAFTSDDEGNFWDNLVRTRLFGK